MFYLLAGAFVSKTVEEASRALRLHFVLVLKTDKFRAVLVIAMLHAEPLQHWVLTSKKTTATIMSKMIENKADICTKLLKLTMFEKSSVDDIQEILMEQMLQVLRSSLAVITYAEKDPGVHRLFETQKAKREGMFYLIRCFHYIPIFK